MKKITLSIMMLLAGFTGYCTTWTITSPGFTFSPATITIMSGDDVNFDIDNIHEVVEVSQATWNANGNTHLDGGFETDSGGGLVTADELTVGTHWYVCVPHASGGMKGIIIVEEATGIEETQLPVSISVYPNPSSGKFQLVMSNSELPKNYDLGVYDVLGRNVYTKSKSEMKSTNDIDLSNVEEGIYILKLRDGIKIYTKKIMIQ